MTLVLALVLAIGSGVLAPGVLDDRACSGLGYIHSLPVCRQFVLHFHY